ncbi:MAG: histidine kinase [Sulfurimonas sp.]|nr:MAG: histidine kinase [Sulfurimonas sp.]
MSIFTKVLTLFFISLSLMFLVSFKTATLTKKTLHSLLKEKYLQASDELFTYLANNELLTLNKKIKEFNFEKLNLKNIKNYKTIYRYNSGLSSIQILEHKKGKYFLYMRYLDDKIFLTDLSQDKYIEEISSLNYYIILDVLILIGMFLLVLKLIYPLKKIANKLKNFGEGEYKTRITINSNNEIGKLAQTFNTMAQNIQTLINSRERLLRDIAHELKTPISKSKLALEMIQDGKYKDILQRTTNDMEDLVNELLSIEKLNANVQTFKLEKFNADSLIVEALSKLYIEDETSINIAIIENFTITSDFYYLSMALKNLIDNALKYSTKKPVEIEINRDMILIKNIGEKLHKSLEYYCQLFTQEDSSRNNKGHGLGLSLVKNILTKLNFQLIYKYENSQNIFVITR